MAYIVTAIAVLFILVTTFTLYSKQRKRGLRRKELMETPFPEEWLKIVKEHMMVFNHMPEQLQKELLGHTLIFLEEKGFEGYKGVEITDEIRVTIAAQASLLMLGRKKPTYYPKLWSVAVFPAAYIAEHKTPMGDIMIEGQSARLGESWSNGKLLLAWSHTPQGISHYRDGHNLVVHEFAHQLDQEDGTADGVPILAGTDHYTPWAKIFSKEYMRLKKESARSLKTVMNRYGTTNPAEFFAVASETFFEKGKQLRKKHPELYNQLKQYYRVDPATWF